MGALVASLRHDGQSIGIVIERWIGQTGKKLFLWFSILLLVLVVAVFLVLTTATFVTDPVVAFVGCLYIVLAVISGLLIYRMNIDLRIVTVVMIAIIAFATIKGGDWQWVNTLFTQGSDQWNMFLSIYILAASVLPVWLLLQPRDYLASYFLYFAVALGAIGMLFGSRLDSGAVPAIAENIKWFGLSKVHLWPMMFVLVACGAISGFHSLVGSGTTAKQIKCESDALPVGYGAMLLEGLVACISIGALMVAGGIQAGGPVGTFAAGFGKFCTMVGIEEKLGIRLGAIAINSFLLTSLDTATRLGRYQIVELSNGKLNKWVATISIIAGALALVYAKTTDATGKVVAAWSVIWPVFGSANQLIAALAILSVAVWIIRGLKKKATFLLIPFVFMLVTSMTALVIDIKTTMASGSPNYVLAAMSAILLVLAVMMAWEGYKALREEKLGHFINN